MRSAGRHVVEWGLSALRFPPPLRYNLYGVFFPFNLTALLPHWGDFSLPILRMGETPTHRAYLLVVFFFFLIKIGHILINEKGSVSRR